MLDENFLARELLTENFGEVVADVGDCLLRNGSRRLQFIVAHTKRKPNMVKKALCVLIHHKMVTFEELPSLRVVYTAKFDQIIFLNMVPRCIYSARDLYGAEAELIVEKLLMNGTMTLATLVRLVMDLAKEMDEELENEDARAFEKVKTSLSQLINAQFIKREPRLAEPSVVVPKFQPEENEFDSFRIPAISFKDFTKAVEGAKSDEAENDAPPKKKMKKEPSIESNGYHTNGHHTSDRLKVYEELWSVNRDRFLLLFRDHMIVEGVEKSLGERHGAVVRAMLRLAELGTDLRHPRTDQFTAHQILATMSSTLPESKVASLNLDTGKIERILSMMEESRESFVYRGDAHIQRYGVDVRQACEALVKSNMWDHITFRFDSDSCKVCRLLDEKKHLEMKSIIKMSLIEDKRCKDIVFSLVSQGIVDCVELSKFTQLATGSKRSANLFLYRLNYSDLTRTLLLRSYSTVANFILKRRTSKVENQRNLLQHDRIEAIKAQLEDEEDIAQYEKEMDVSCEQAVKKHKHVVEMSRRVQLNTSLLSFLFAYHIDLQIPLRKPVEKKKRTNDDDDF